MYTLVVVILFLGYGFVLIIGLLRLARELTTTPFPRPLSYWDYEAHRDDDPIPSAAPTRASCDTIDEGRQNTEQQ